MGADQSAGDFVAMLVYKGEHGVFLGSEWIVGTN
jgi:hypothetical protein